MSSLLILGSSYLPLGKSSLFQAIPWFSKLDLQLFNLIQEQIAFRLLMGPCQAFLAVSECSISIHTIITEVKIHLTLCNLVLFFQPQRNATSSNPVLLQMDHKPVRNFGKIQNGNFQTLKTYKVEAIIDPVVFAPCFEF